MKNNAGGSQMSTADRVGLHTEQGRCLSEATTLTNQTDVSKLTTTVVANKHVCLTLHAPARTRPNKPVMSTIATLDV
jgi:hypothetical protein